jgi:hypothetical protein
MEEVCNKLKDTYNASILNNENTVTQAVFEHISRKNAEGYKGNTTLMKLILNYYNNKKMLNKIVYNKIGGPVSLTLQWSAQYNMYVYIFGEYHAEKIDCDIAPLPGKFSTESIRDGCGAKKIRNPITKKCVNEDGVIGKQIIKEAKEAALKKEDYIKVEEYLKDLFLTTNAFIDFYLETPGYTGEDYQYGVHPWLGAGRDRLVKLSTNFEECLRAITRKHSYLCRNVRVHYLDIRKEAQMKDVNDVSHLRNVYNIIRSNPYMAYHNKLSQLQNDPRIDETIKKLRTGDTYEYINFWKKQLLQSSIVKKEFSRTILPKNVLQDFLEKEITIRALGIREIFRTYLTSWDTPNVNLDDIMRGISATVLLNAYVMDMYTISRMFKKFKNVENQPERPRNIILYAGDAHSTVCRKFLDQLGFQTINKTAGVNYNTLDNNKYGRNSPAYNNCVDISVFKQPFFSVYPPTK